jgi:hypothetical protein
MLTHMKNAIHKPSECLKAVPKKGAPVRIRCLMRTRLWEPTQKSLTVNPHMHTPSNNTHHPPHQNQTHTQQSTLTYPFHQSTNNPYKLCLTTPMQLSLNHQLSLPTPYISISNTNHQSLG